MNRMRDRSGFTLMELIVVIGLISVVTTLSAVMFSKLNDYWRTAWRETELDARARYAMDQVRQDLNAVLPPSLSGTPVRGTNASTQANDQTMADDQIVLPVQLPVASTGLMATAAVRYSVERPKSGPSTLKRYLGKLEDTTPAGEATTVAVGVTQFKVEYLGQGANEWVPEWTQPTLPAAVRVSVAVSSEERPDVSVSRKEVFRIPVSG